GSLESQWFVRADSAVSGILVCYRTIRQLAMCLDALVGGSQRGLEKGHAHSIFRRIRANGRSKHGEISSRLGKGRTRLFDRGGFRGFRGSRPSLQEHGRVRRFSITRSEGKQYAK